MPGFLANQPQLRINYRYSADFNNKSEFESAMKKQASKPRRFHDRDYEEIVAGLDRMSTNDNTERPSEIPSTVFNDPFRDI